MKKLLCLFIFGEAGVTLAAPTGIFDIILQIFLLGCYVFMGIYQVKQFMKKTKDPDEGENEHK